MTDLDEPISKKIIIHVYMYILSFTYFTITIIFFNTCYVFIFIVSYVNVMFIQSQVSSYEQCSVDMNTQPATKAFCYFFFKGSHANDVMSGTIR
jgi:hypothetical protein